FRARANRYRNGSRQARSPLPDRCASVHQDVHGSVRGGRCAAQSILGREGRWCRAVFRSQAAVRRRRGRAGRGRSGQSYCAIERTGPAEVADRERGGTIYPCVYRSGEREACGEGASAAVTDYELSIPALTGFAARSNLWRAARLCGGCQHWPPARPVGGGACVQQTTPTAGARLPYLGGWPLAQGCSAQATLVHADVRTKMPAAVAAYTLRPAQFE